MSVRSKINRMFRLLPHVQRMTPGRSLQHGITLDPEHLYDHFTQRIFILGHKDCFAATEQRGINHWFHFFQPSCRSAEINPEGGATIWFAVNHQLHPRCARTIPKTVDKPRPVPLPTGLVVKNGSKMRPRFLVSIPSTGIGERQTDEIPSRWIGSTESRGAVDGFEEVVMVMHPPLGMASVRPDGQVHCDLLHHAGIGMMAGRDAWGLKAICTCSPTSRSSI